MQNVLAVGFSKLLKSYMYAAGRTSNINGSLHSGYLTATELTNMYIQMVYVVMGSWHNRALKLHYRSILFQVKLVALHLN